MDKRILLLLIIFASTIIVIGELEAIVDDKGTLEVSVRCHNNLFSKQISIWKDVPNGTSVPVEGYLNPSGKYEARFEPGIYHIYLYDGNGGKPEKTMAVVTKGYQARVFFIGHAVSARGNASATNPAITPTPTTTIPVTIAPTPVPTTTMVIPTLLPKHCYIVCIGYETIIHPEVNHTLTHCGHTTVIVDEEAVTEIIWSYEWRCDDLPHQHADYCIM